LNPQRKKFHRAKWHLNPKKYPDLYKKLKNIQTPGIDN